VAVAVTAMSVAPASATFKSLINTKGQAKLQRMTFESGGLTITCQSASGEWHLQSKGKFEEHEKEGKQVALTNGPHLYITVSKWNNCEGEALNIKVAAAIEACEFQVVQPQKGATKGTVSLIGACVIKMSAPFTCTITLLAGKEVTGTNAFLKEFKLETNKQDGALLMSPNVEGISGTATCLEEEKFTNGKLSGAAGSIGTEGGVVLA
jgi:hypothetical protein